MVYDMADQSNLARVISAQSKLLGVVDRTGESLRRLDRYFTKASESANRLGQLTVRPTVIVRDYFSFTLNRLYLQLADLQRARVELKLVINDQVVQTAKQLKEYLKDLGGALNVQMKVMAECKCPSQSPAQPQPYSPFIFSLPQPKASENKPPDANEAKKDKGWFEILTDWTDKAGKYTTLANDSTDLWEKVKKWGKGDSKDSSSNEKCECVCTCICKCTSGGGGTGGSPTNPREQRTAGNPNPTEGTTRSGSEQQRVNPPGGGGSQSGANPPGGGNPAEEGGSPTPRRGGRSTNLKGKFKNFFGKANLGNLASKMGGVASDMITGDFSFEDMSSSLIPKGAGSGGSIISKGLHGAGKLLGKAAGPIGALLSVADIATSDNKPLATTKAIAGTAGSAVGAALGSLILPGVGTVVGGAVGGMVGDWAGGWLGNKLFGKKKSVASGSPPTELLPRDRSSSSTAEVATALSPSAIAAQSSNRTFNISVDGVNLNMPKEEVNETSLADKLGKQIMDQVNAALQNLQYSVG